MHEKAEVEHKEMEAQMLIFMMNRSARILQKYFFFCLIKTHELIGDIFRYWRTFVSKRKKKKGKRGRKK